MAAAAGGVGEKQTVAVGVDRGGDADVFGVDGLDDVAEGVVGSRAQIDGGGDSRGIGDLKLSERDAVAGVVVGQGGVRRNVLVLEISAVDDGLAGGESSGDSQAGGGGGIGVGDDQVSAPAGGVYQLQSGARCIERGGDAGVGAVDVVDNVVEAGGAGKIHIGRRIAGAVGDGDGSQGEPRAAFEGAGEDG